jgi:2-hydroxyglutarate dehydrogenase
MAAMPKNVSHALFPFCHRPRGLRRFSHCPSRNSEFTHAVVGAGVIGLAVARQLQKRNGASTVLIEQHGAVGTETSSRNSEVIHAGIYYGSDSLKTKLCIRGRELLYQLCREKRIPFRVTGKWIVAQNEEEFEQLEKIYSLSKAIGVPTKFLSKTEGISREPDVEALAGILESTSTGIVDSHALMLFLLGDYEDAGGIAALNTTVTRIVPRANGRNGWEVWTKQTQPGSHGADEDTESCVVVDTVINSAGLYAIPISNSILPMDRRLEPVYAKGTYYTYSSSKPSTKTLVYPAPVPGHAGLGTHLTLDLGGRIRFGPDVQWVDSPTDYNATGKNLDEAIKEIRRYLPGVDASKIHVDYCGIRPKLSTSGSAVYGKGFQDFIVRYEDGFTGFVNLLGIESPGLTSSLAISEMVDDLLYRRI